MKPLHLVLCSILLVGGCSTSKKFNFNAAYKFSYYDYSKQSVSPSPPADNLVASTDSEILVIPPKISDGSLRTAQPQFKPDLKDLSQTELKQIRKELKQEIRSLDSEIESLEKSKKLVPEQDRSTFESSITEKKVQRDAVKAMNHKIFLGILIGAAGLVLIIIGGSTLGAVGGIALVVGLVLIVWGLIEKGSF